MKLISLSLYLYAEIELEKMTTLTGGLQHKHSVLPVLIIQL